MLRLELLCCSTALIGCFFWLSTSSVDIRYSTLLKNELIITSPCPVNMGRCLIFLSMLRSYCSPCYSSRYAMRSCSSCRSRLANCSSSDVLIWVCSMFLWLNSLFLFSLILFKILLVGLVLLHYFVLLDLISFTAQIYYYNSEAFLGNRRIFIILLERSLQKFI